jgi:hypothetical protein
VCAPERASLDASIADLNIPFETTKKMQRQQPTQEEENNT